MQQGWIYCESLKPYVRPIYSFIHKKIIKGIFMKYQKLLQEWVKEKEWDDEVTHNEETNERR